MLIEIELFLVMKEAEGRVKATLYEYKLYLTTFAEFCGKPLLTDVRPVHVNSWIVTERRKGLSDKSIHARWAALHTFFGWCVQEEYLNRTPVTMKPPKRTQPVVRVASYPDVQKLMNFPLVDWMDHRDRALLHLLLDTGMRIGEVCNLRVQDVHLDNKLAHIATSKNGKGRLVPFTDACAESVTRYLESRPTKHQSLFVGTRRSVILGGLTVSGAQCMIERRCKAVGLKYINPHSIRHLFATRALNAGLRVEVVSRILGHATVDFTLRVYASLLMDTIKREYDKHWQTDLAVQEV